jgi:hypothetical protein
MRNWPLVTAAGWNGYSFRNALLAKGAGTVLGWNNTVGTILSGQVAKFFFERVLGAGAGQVPPQRPFSVPEVKAVMRAKRMDIDFARPGNPLGASLVMEQFSQAATILAPSLRNMTIGDPAVVSTASEKAGDSELHLFGEFGTKAGQVRISGSPVSLKGSWDSKHLIALIPKTGSTASGPVEVEVTPASQVITGNEAPLTSWSGTAHAKVTFTTFGSPGPFSEITCSGLHLRGDIHPFRMAPEEEARAGTAGADNSFRAQVDMANSVGDTLCGLAIGGSFGVATVTPETRANVPWIVNETAAYPAHPGWWFVVNAKIDTTNANAVTLWVASKDCSPTIFHYPDPIGDITVPDFCLTTAPASFNAHPPPPLVPTTFNMLQPKVTFTTDAGDTAELEFNLNASSIPTPQTEG